MIRNSQSTATVRPASEQDEKFPQPRYLLLLCALVLVWAASWPIIKIAVAEVPPIWLGFLRYGIATVLLFAVLCFKRGLILPLRPDWPLIIVSGGLQMAAYSALMGIALVTLPPGRASVLAYSTPIWVVPLAAWWLAERMPVMRLAGVAFGVLGIATIASPTLMRVEGEQATAYLALVLASMCWAFSIVFVRRHRFAASAFDLAPWQMLVSAALLLLPALLFEGLPPALGATGFMTLAFLGPISTAFAYWAVVEAGRYFQASTLSVALMATPALGIVISAATLGETIDALLITGAAMVGCGIWMTSIVATYPRS